MAGCVGIIVYILQYYNTYVYIIADNIKIKRRDFK